MIQPLSMPVTKKKEAVLKWIRDRVDYSREAEQKPYTFHRSISFLDCQLPRLAGLNQQLRTLYIRSVVDEDMKMDLENCRSINWLPQAIRLTPVNVPRDGNCLLHAASMAVWGVEDSRNTLRDLMLMTIKINCNFKKRWWSQLMKDLQSLNIDESEIIEQEWDDVIRSISDLDSTTKSVAVPHRFLEGIHIYIVANILRRPIIVVSNITVRSVAGLDLQENHIGGVYLPLEWAPLDCCKTPIILGYSLNHFCPLLSETQLEHGSSQTEKKVMHMFPLVTNDLNFLLVKFLKEEEELQAWELVQSYLQVKEVEMPDTGARIPFAQMQLRPLEPGQNSLFEQLKLIKEKLMEEELQKNTQGHMYTILSAAEQRNHPFYDIEMNSQTEVVPIRQNNSGLPGDNRNTSYLHNQVEQQKNNTARLCITEGCNKHGSEKLNHMCVHCYRVLSQDKNVTKPTSQNITNTNQGHVENPMASPVYAITPTAPPVHAITPTAPLLSLEPPSNDPLLSMMAERCRNGCGYRCSNLTYPYCHECSMQRTKESEQNMILSPPSHNSNTVLNDQPLSMMAERCKNGCGYRCSNLTYPYCHECSLKKTKEPEQNVMVENCNTLIIEIGTSEKATSVPKTEFSFANLIQAAMSSSPASSTHSSSQLSSSESSSLLGSGNASHLFSFPSEESSQLFKSGSETLMDKNCKHFDRCSGVKMLDHDICFSCAQNENSVTNTGKNAETKTQLPGNRNIMIAETNAIGSHEDLATSFAETNVGSMSADIEVSEEPTSKIRCYCGTLIFPQEKLCSRCKNILQKGYEQTSEYSKEKDQIVLNTISKIQPADVNMRSLQDGKYTDKISSNQEATAKLEGHNKETPHSTSKPAQFVSAGPNPHPAKGKHCMTAGCSNYGDPMMDNKCSSCYYESNPLAKPRSPLAAEKKTKAPLLYPRQDSNEKLPKTQLSKHSMNAQQTERLYNAKQTNRLTPQLLLHSSGAKTAPVKTNPHMCEANTSYPYSLSFEPYASEPSLELTILGNPEAKDVMVTSKTGHSSFSILEPVLDQPSFNLMPNYSSLHPLPEHSSYSFNHNPDRSFERTFHTIEVEAKKNVKKCVSSHCDNYGNNYNKGYCNSCFKVIHRQKIIEQEAKYGMDVPDK